MSQNFRLKIQNVSSLVLHLRPIDDGEKLLLLIHYPPPMTYQLLSHLISREEDDPLQQRFLYVFEKQKYIVILRHFQTDNLRRRQLVSSKLLLDPPYSK